MDKKRIVQFAASGNKTADRKAKNIIKVYIWNEVDGMDFNAKAIAHFLRVNVRTAYRYLKVIEEVKKELITPPDTP